MADVLRLRVFPPEVGLGLATVLGDELGLGESCASVRPVEPVRPGSGDAEERFLSLPAS